MSVSLKSGLGQQDSKSFVHDFWKGYEWAEGRSTKIQKSARPVSICAEAWTELFKIRTRRRNCRIGKINLKLQPIRRKWRSCEVSADDNDYIKDCRDALISLKIQQLGTASTRDSDLEIEECQTLTQNANFFTFGTPLCTRRCRNCQHDTLVLRSARNIYRVHIFVEHRSFAHSLSIIVSCAP